MIFNELFSAWKQNDLLTQAINDSHEMIDISFRMYQTVTELLLKEYKQVMLEEVKKEDYLLNHFEKSIRKKVFEHVSVNEKGDQGIYTAILLVTIVGDIERIGDYAKNIAEVAEIKNCLFDEKLNVKVETFVKDVMWVFKNTLEAFKESDKEKADKIIDKQFGIKTEIDNILMELATKKVENNENYVAYALLLRYLKRTSSHLKNIASSITNPIDMIGYYMEREDEE